VNREAFISSLFQGNSSDFFQGRALELFRYQYKHNVIYRAYSDALGISVHQVNAIEEIPFLPISFFKTHRVSSSTSSVMRTFESSATTGQTTSKHHLVDLKLYERSFLAHFIQRYGHPSEYEMLALLPSYLERNNSSLVYMVDYLIKASGGDQNAFFLYDFIALKKRWDKALAQGKKVMLWGVTFALLDFALQCPGQMDNTIIMETGGMKGRGREPIRQEVYGALQQAWPNVDIHSEYGMTELLSQAYAAEMDALETPDWMRVWVRDIQDPLGPLQEQGRGSLHIIDLANVDSCAFIATQDLGEIAADGRFKVLGRLSYAETRGCNLLYQP
jgi:hypothetical protein